MQYRQRKSNTSEKRNFHWGQYSMCWSAVMYFKINSRKRWCRSEDQY